MLPKTRVYPSPSSPYCSTASRVPEETTKALNDHILDLVPLRILRAATEVNIILTQLARHLAAADSLGAILFIQRLHDTPGLMPCLMFKDCNHQKTDTAVATMILKYIRSAIIETDAREWRLDAIDVVGRILALVCGRPLSWKQNQRHCEIFEFCVRGLGIHYRSLCLWLFTVGDHTPDLMPHLLQSGNAGYAEEMHRRMVCNTWAHDKLRLFHHQLFEDFTYRLMSLSRH